MQACIGDQLTLLLPITVRDQVIGVINLSKETLANSDNRTMGLNSNRTKSDKNPIMWNNEEVEVLKSIVEQLGIVLDSARLFGETRLLAERERIIDQVSSEMRASLEIDSVLQTAVCKLWDALGLAEVEVRLGNGA